MAFAILRTKKLKSFGEIGGSLAHTYRTRPTPNANPDLRHDNWHQELRPNFVKNGIQNRLPEKVRSNAVLCVEYLMTASPEWSGWANKTSTKEYFDKCIQWLHDQHGAENVISTSIHNDETTPHLIAYVVPIDPTGKLNCRYFLGGKKNLSEMQTNFHNKVKDLGLERGLIGSKLRHQTIQQFYSKLNTEIKAPKTINFSIKQLSFDNQPKTNFFEKHHVHGKRVMDMVYSDVDKQIEQSNNDFNMKLSKVHKEAQMSIKKLEIKLEQYIEAYERTVQENRELKKELSVFMEYKKYDEKEYLELKSKAINVLNNRDYNINYKKYIKDQELEQKVLQQENIRKKEQEIYLNKIKQYKTDVIVKFKNTTDNILVNNPILAPLNNKNHYEKIREETIKYLEENPLKIIQEIPNNHENIYIKMLLNLNKNLNSQSYFALDDAKYWLQELEGKKEEHLNLYEVDNNRKACLASFNICQNFLLEQNKPINDSDLEIIRSLQDSLFKINNYQANFIFTHLVNEDEITKNIQEYEKQKILENENNATPPKQQNNNDNSFNI